MVTRRYEVVLLLGSNIEPATHVPKALRLIEERFALVDVSATLESPAVGGAGEAPDFWNVAARVRTDLPYRALRLACRRIEEACGRRRTADRFAPRTMDIDVVFADPALCATSAGAVPDPELLAHAHLLVPTAGVWPDAVHPDTGRTLADHLAEDREDPQGTTSD